MDAGAAGAQITPRDAYRFARGEEITASSNQPVKLSRPLDFLVVADHSDGFGFFPQLMSGDPELLATEQGKKWYDLIKAGKGAEAAFDVIQAFSANNMPKGFPVPGTKAYRSAWQEVIKAAETYNDRADSRPSSDRWTVNWVATTCTQHHLPRQAQASLAEPYTTIEPLDDNRGLMEMDGRHEAKTAAKCTIAHSNLSNGTMFPTIEAFGKKIDKEYVETRARWERLYEVTQMKGDGETHPYLSPNDEFANFERWDKANLAVIVKHTNDMFEGEYARAALKNGLVLEQKLGVNPYKFGMIGSTDAHTGLATAERLLGRLP
jgi:hypothetical protein